jgi:hypothetical protein
MPGGVNRQALRPEQRGHVPRRDPGGVTRRHGGGGEHPAHCLILLILGVREPDRARRPGRGRQDDPLSRVEPAVSELRLGLQGNRYLEHRCRDYLLVRAHGKLPGTVE